MQNAIHCARVRIVVRGVVQGVGFRPFVYRLAMQMGMHGWVLNSAGGVVIEVEGEEEGVRRFIARLRTEKPPLAMIQSLETACLTAVGGTGFEIRYSDGSGEKTTFISPEIATCPDCVREIFDRDNRRYRYPFTNCTNCGPRFTIIESLPYDRAYTSMKQFEMCAECAREYHDPLDRRFHAQPNACPNCGPQLALWDCENTGSNAGNGAATRDAALAGAAERVRNGEVLALKGIGGFHLIVDASNEAAVACLRKRKCRAEKPFAVMFPSLEAVREECVLDDLEEKLLCSAEAPIIILARRAGAKNRGSRLAPAIAPGNPSLGVMLPYTPLHHLLLGELGFPVVATSGNLSNEPICIDEREAVDRLRGIADCFLVHDRPILRHMDDSVVRVMCGRELVLRRARGYAPLPVHAGRSIPATLAVGAHLKNTVALSVGGEVFISQHLGDLETAEAYAAFCKAAADLPRLYEATPQRIVCDLHPDYLSTKYAAGMDALEPLRPPPPRPVRHIQHHWAHVAACMAENELAPPVLGIAWDGTGYGLDGTIWGGEFLKSHGGSFERAGHFRTFRLPGGEAAIQEPRRCALGLLYEIMGETLWDRFELLPAFSKNEISLIRKMLEKGINVPLTSSAGRLFDGVAALAGLRGKVSFEGQAAMELEFAAAPGIDEAYPFEIRGGSPFVIDWQPAILEIVRDVRRGDATGVISAKFHNMLAEIIVAVARKIGEPKVVITGGCFQNKVLVERTVQRLLDRGFQPYWHRFVPPNDGGIALGQIIAGAGVWTHGEGFP